MNESKIFKETKKNILLQFSATWCGPCRILAPTIDQIEQKTNQYMDVKRIDVDQDQEVAITYMVRGVPTLILLDKDGNVFWRHTGLISENDLLAKIESMR
ncbi:MAG: thioredoxin family protein [Sphingobacterium sp.]|jgi:thioredoxin 1|nr:thioredoxin family protein [Sphingobacterium sp.]